MALNDDAVFTAAKGYVFTKEVGGTGALTPAMVSSFTEATGLTGWVDLGHTDREDLPEFGYEGGDVETRGTWRAAALREVITEAATDYVVITLSQWDDEALSMYYGVQNAEDAAEGEFVVTDSSTATVERALAVIIEDGAYRIGFYAPRASIRREDSMELAVDAFSKMPVRASFLKATGQPLFKWVSPTILNQDAG